MDNDPHRVFWCFIKDDFDAFEISAPVNASLSRLKDMVWEKGRNSTFRTTDAKNLVFWKLEVPVPIAPPQGLAGRIALLELPQCATQLLDPSITLLDVFSEDPVAKSVHIIVERRSVVGRPSQDSELPGLKRKREPPNDITEALLERWSNLTITLPTSSHDLVEYFKKPLEEDEKMPLSHYNMSALVSHGQPEIRCSEGDLRRIFRFSEDEESDYLWTILKATLVTSAPDKDGTEASFISFWDDNIRKIITHMVTPIKIIRDRSRSTSTASQRPDFGVLLEGVCAFRGEEKAPHYGRKHPKDELLEKMVWTYDPAPWILGYHAVGAEVTLSAIYHSSIDDISMLDLSYRSRRVENILRMIKLVSLLRLLREGIGPRDYPEFTPIIRETGTTIEIRSSCIKKTYTGTGRKARISHLRTIYQLLRQKDVPHVDSVLNIFDDKSHGAVAYLQPKGVNRRPTSAQEVLEAVLCLLEALTVMHDNPKRLFHRDIRWPNIILLPSDHSRWFLIDWDDAAMAPTRAAKHLDPKSHSPACFQDNHGAEVDIWGAGKLILDAREFVPAIPDKLATIGKQMVEGVIKTAKEAESKIRKFTT